MHPTNEQDNNMFFIMLDIEDKFIEKISLEENFFVKFSLFCLYSSTMPAL